MQICQQISELLRGEAGGEAGGHGGVGDFFALGDLAGGDVHGHADGGADADGVVALAGHKADVRFLVLGGEGIGVKALRDDSVGVEDGLQQFGGFVAFANVDEVGTLG